MSEREYEDEEREEEEREPLEGVAPPGQPRAGQGAAEPAPRTRIPPEDPRAREVGKRFVIGDEPRDAPLVVSLSEGSVMGRYAPAQLVARFAERIAILLKDLGGGAPPMLYGVVPGSMTLLFGDPEPQAELPQLPVPVIAAQAERVGELIDLEDDALFARALQIGGPVRQYDELVQLVQSEGVTLRWVVAGVEPRVLSPDRAERQHTRLSAPVETRDRPLKVNGLLYRVITESTREGFLGSAGIHLFSWSTRPPGDGSKQRLIAFFERSEVREKIKAGLIGEPVEARLLIRQPVPGTSIEPERFDLILDDIQGGPPEDALLGPGLLDEEE